MNMRSEITKTMKSNEFVALNKNGVFENKNKDVNTIELASYEVNQGEKTFRRKICDHHHKKKGRN